MANPEMTREEAEALLGEIGVLQRESDQITKKQKEAVARLQAEAATALAPLSKKLLEKRERLKAWANAHRSELLTGDVKTARLATGELKWRFAPASLVIPDEKATIGKLDALDLGGLLIVDVSINRPGLLKQVLSKPELKEQLGVEVKQEEVFDAKPYGA